MQQCSTKQLKTRRINERTHTHKHANPNEWKKNNKIRKNWQYKFSTITQKKIYAKYMRYSNRFNDGILFDFNDFSVEKRRFHALKQSHDPLCFNVE